MKDSTKILIGYIIANLVMASAAYLAYTDGVHAICDVIFMYIGASMRADVKVYSLFRNSKS